MDFRCVGIERRTGMAKGSVRESITSLLIRVGDSPKLPAPCPVCNCPFGPSEQAILRVVRCARCGKKYHEPCFWRLLPLEEWVEYIQWAMETNEDEEDDGDEENEEHEDGFEIICGGCREK
jgi:hypothetical protein